MTDFVVIGGGIAGASAGARLSHLGRVRLLETEPGLGYHASGRSAALFEQTYGMPSTVALNRASKAYHMDANGGVLSPRGLMILCRAGETDAFEADLRKMEMTEIGPDEARRRVPILSPGCRPRRFSRRGVGHRHRSPDPEFRRRDPRQWRPDQHRRGGHRDRTHGRRLDGDGR